MAELTINRLDHVESEPTGQHTQPVANRLTEEIQQSKNTAVAGKDTTKEAPNDSSRSLSNVVSMAADTSLRFVVNGETKEVSVLVVDRQTHKVLFTIPTEAIKELLPGDLVQYSV
jgi:uncharacterized FlaG/YvyC family protein